MKHHDEIDDENGRLFGSLHDEKFGKLHDHSRFQSNLQGRRLGSVRKPVRRTRSANLANTYSTHCHGSFELDDKDMFEAPTSTADFELAAMAALHPLSLKARFRSAFKGLKPNQTSGTMKPGSGSSVSRGPPMPATSTPTPAAPAFVKVNSKEFGTAPKITGNSASVSKEQNGNQNASLRDTTMNRENAMPGTSASNSKAPKDIEVALQFFYEVMRTDKIEMLLGSVEAIFDAVIEFISHLKHKSPPILDALVALLDWAENKMTDEDIEGAKSIKSEGVRLANDLQKKILEHNDKAPPITTRTSTNLRRQRRVSPPSTDSGFFTDFSSEGSPSINRSFSRTESTSASGTDQSIDDLLAQLNLRQVAKFEPIFPTVENDDSDDDDSAVTVDEHREEREEKKDTKTCEEEVQRLADGSEIRTKKTRTFNLQQSSKHVTIRTHGGGGGDEQVKNFQDGDISFNDDIETEDFFTTPLKPRFGRNRGVGVGANFGDHLLREATPPEDGTSQKIKTVQHSNAVKQSVAKTAKRNGKVISDDAAHKIDTSELNAKQIETFKGEKLLDRQGSGSYEEQSVVKMGLPSGSSSPPPVPPKRRHVVQYMQTFGNKKEDEKDDFFKGATLASYIVLNDNLRYHEEQYRKQISFEFSLSGTSAPSQDFSNLSQLLQHSDYDRIRLPTRYTDEADEAQQKTITYPQHLPLTGSPGVLESLDVSEWLVLRAKDAHSKPNEVRGGPKDALIAFATQPSGSLLYQEAFLTTYRTFVSSLELIQKLVRRYLYMCLTEDQASTKAARQSFSVLVRVVDELCAVELTRDLVRAVTSFVYRLIRDGNYTFAKILRRRLMVRIEQKSTAKKSPWSDIPMNVKSPKPVTLFEFRSGLLAKQMTYLDADLFQKIEPAEMLWWAQEQDEKKSPNLCAFTEHFNKVSYWVRTLVIQPSEQRLREKYLLKFVKIMKQLRSMGNYNSYLAILSALDSGPIRRLDWTKGALEMLKEHSAIMDSSHSFKNYRTLLAESRPPCLPYIGLVLQDLTFVNVGNSDYLSPDHCQGKTNLLNYGKRWQQFAILDSVRRFKSWNYSIQRDDRILQFFGGFRNYLSEDDIWEISETIKPRTRKNK
uniref:Rap guanine nucleotide exchange factor 1 n=1 Tax=Ascaris suum TaxID=6253 RepID=F1KRH4_ASCSU